MSGSTQAASRAGTVITWVAVTGAIIFGCTFAALMGLRPAWFRGSGSEGTPNDWALIPLIVVIAALLALAGARMMLGISRLVDTPEHAGSSTVIALWKRPWVPWALIALALIMFIAIAFGLLAVVHVADVPNELSLPVLAIAGVVALLGSLAVVAVSFSLMNMADKTQPLGLPQGSVRAVISLSLVVLFAILSVYLFSSVNAPVRVGFISCLDEATSANMAQDRSVPDRMYLRRVATNCQPADKGAPGSTNTDPTSPQLYDVIVERSPSREGVDFAKQLLVLIGTLVTSVASFYFGSQAVSQARDAVAGLGGPPTATGVQPETLEWELGPKKDELWLDILGTGLNTVRHVQLTRGTEQINAVSVTSNDSRVQALLKVPATAVSSDTTDPWDVTVSDAQGRSYRMPSAVRIVKRASANVTPRNVGQASQGNSTAGQPSLQRKSPEQDSQEQKPQQEALQQQTSPEQTSQDQTLQAQKPEFPTTTDAARLEELRKQVDVEKNGLAALRSAGAGPALPAVSESTLAQLTAWLASTAELAKGQATPLQIATAIDTGTSLLATAQNAGLPGAIADALAVLGRVGGVAAPVIAGIPAGPVGIVLGVLTGLTTLAADQKKLDAAKAALLNAPFDPGIPPASPTSDMAGVLVRNTPFSTATDEQALIIMQAALEQRDGQPVPADDVATKLLGNPLVAPIMQQFATPALRVAAIETLRGRALFQQARKLLGDTLEIDLPAVADTPAGKVDFIALLQWLQQQRNDPQLSATIERLVGIADMLGQIPDGQARMDRLLAALATGNTLSQTNRQH